MSQTGQTITKCTFDLSDVDAFASRLVAHLEDGAWEAGLTTFALSHSDAFKAYVEEMQQSRPVGEHHHGLHEAYQEFVTLTDSMLNDFLVREGLGQADFVDLCKQAQESEANWSLIDALLSATEYQQFVGFMLDFMAEDEDTEPVVFDPPARSQDQIE
ncbi:unnamed protein product [Polarella glacialis]|uniref:BART domain-containing protein n=1 Tax=Polarella glacialis TaxID=89957 RepID=A0A813E4G6_POLGL|nr:unnamed protein product [Polarella glacialis]